MDWVPDPSAPVPPPLEDQPRYLTNAEIEDIVQNFPTFRGCDSVTREVTRSQFIAYTREALRSIKICPSQIPALREVIVRQHLNAQIEAGTPIGTIAAESTASVFTQLSLSGAKMAGARTFLSNNVRTMQELLFARKNRQTSLVYIHFKDPRNQLSLEKVFDLQAEIVGSTVYSLLIEDERESEMGKKSPDAAVVGLVEDVVGKTRPPWYSFFTAVLGKSWSSRYVLRLRFDVNLLFLHRITTAQIAQILEAEKPTPSVVVVYSPTWGVVGPTGNREAIVDIYPISHMIHAEIQKLVDRGTDPELYDSIYLTEFWIPELDKIRVKGIRGIRSLTPVSTRVWSVITNERRILPSDPPDLQALLSTEGLQRLGTDSADRVWLAFFQPDVMKIRGITVERLGYLCAQAGIKVFKLPPLPESIPVSPWETRERSNMILLVMPSGKDSPPNEKPGSLLDRLVGNDKAERIRKFLESKGKAPLEQTELMRAAEYVYGVAEGTNLIEVLGHRLVDSTRTYSNDLHRMADVLGIEAARKFFIQDFTSIVESSECYINPLVTIYFIADYSTMGGVPRGVTHHGMRHTDNGFFTRSTFQEAPGVIQNAALTGSREGTTGASIAIATGRNISMGTGTVELIPDQERIAEARARLRARGTPISVEDATRAIEDPDLTPDALMYDVQGGEKSVDLLNFPGTTPPSGAVITRRLEVLPVTPISTRDRLMNRTPRGAPVVPKALLEALEQFSSVTPAPERPHEVITITALPTGLLGTEIGETEEDIPLPPIPRDPRGLPDDLVISLLSRAPAPTTPGGVLEETSPEEERQYSSIVESGAPLTYAFPPVPTLDLPPLPVSLYQEALEAGPVLSTITQEDPSALASILGFQ